MNKHVWLRRLIKLLEKCTQINEKKFLRFNTCFLNKVKTKIKNKKKCSLSKGMMVYAIAGVIGIFSSVSFAQSENKKSFVRVQEPAQAHEVGNLADARGYGALAVGYSSKASGSYSSSLGYQAASMGNSALALGSCSLSNSAEAVAVGANAVSNIKGSVALGSHSSANRDYNEVQNNKIKQEMSPETNKVGINFFEVSLGKKNRSSSGAKYSQITHLAPATEDTDAVNLFQTKNMITREVKDTTSKIVKKLEDDVNNSMNFFNEGNDGTVYIGKKLKSTTVSVSGEKGDRIINGVAEGIKSNDAANMGQLNRVDTIVKSTRALSRKNAHKLLSVTNIKVERGLAASAALNGLFQPYGVGMVNITAGIGGYGFSQALAIGSGYRLDKNIAIKAGVAYSGGANVMYNVSFNLEW